MVFSIEALSEATAPIHSNGDYNRELDTGEASKVIDRYAHDLTRAKQEIDPHTLDHEYGVAQLAARMLPPEAAERQINLLGFDVSLRDLVIVCGGLHDTGKYRSDIQSYLKQGVFSRELRSWVRTAHCSEGDWQIYLYQKQNRIPDEQQPVLQAARWAAKHHHSEVPDDYELPGKCGLLPDPDKQLIQQEAMESGVTVAQVLHARSVAWGVTHYIKYCDVLHAVGFDQSCRRAYQKERSGLQPVKTREEVFEIEFQECGKRNPNIDGLEIDIEGEVRKCLNLPSKAAVSSRLGTMALTT